MLNFELPCQMERASRIFGSLNVLPSEQIACSAWRKAVGKKIAAHTRAAKLVRTRLVVEVEDAQWQRNLFLLSRQILKNVVDAIGPGMVEELEFRIVPRRREPQRALAASVPAERDDADGIADPVLRKIYRQARFKETA